ncbi:MAG: DSD1 family PLP-dependent enzyme [Acidobacteriaceae bacterium]
MTDDVPAAIGMPLNEVDTPSLLIDLDAFERNLRRMADITQQAGIALRPHAKTHKSPSIALRQIELGAVGVCCQKVSEAEVMVQGGVQDVLVSNEIVGPKKLERLAKLARLAHIGVCVDNAENVAALSEAASRYQSTLDVLVEIDVGSHRCGVPAGQPALDLARMVADSPGLRFTGLQSYYGAAQHRRPYEERREGGNIAAKLCSETRDLLRSHGLECRTITGSGTGTYEFEAAAGVCNELQVGSYIFMDADYAKNLARDGAPSHAFEQSLFVWTTVMSCLSAEQVAVDAGMKALSVDSGLPEVDGIDGAEYFDASDEHGKIALRKPNTTVKLGDKWKLIPGHCDPTVNLHDWYVGIRNDRVEALWPISARGPGY